MSHIVNAKVQKWGNGLGLRVSGMMRDIPHFEVNTEVTVEIFKNGFFVKKKPIKNKLTTFSEKELLDDLDNSNSHQELLAKLTPSELDLDV